MGYGLSFDDVKTNRHVDNDKIDSCSFKKIVQGDYILINFWDRGIHDEDGWHNACHLGNLFVKVVSVKLPHEAGFFRDEFFGQVTIELPSGKRTELLGIDGVLPEVYQYFKNNCFPERENPIHITVSFAGYNGGNPELQKAMREEYSRRDRRRAELCSKNEEQSRADQIKFEKQRRAEREAEKARLREQRQRNDATANRETDNLFRNPSASFGFNYFACPNCGTNCRVPAKGKTLHITCPNCKSGFDRFS